MSLKLPGLVPIDYVWLSPLRRVPPPPATATVILTPRSRARLARIVRRAPEVVVKVKARTRSGAQLRAHLRYIGRRGAVALHGSDGLAHRGQEAVDGFVVDWSSDLALVPPRGRRPETISQGIILSMPPGTDPEVVLAASKGFAEAQFPTHDWLVALHTDEKHPHTHLAVRMRGRDGRQLRIGREDLQLLREGFAAALRERGVMAEATPRRTRGVSRRAERTAQHHMIRRGQIPDRWVSAAREAGQGSHEAKPAWTAAMRDRQDDHRRLLAAAADELGRSAAVEDRTLADDVRRYTASLPDVRTRGDLLAKAFEEERQRRGAMPGSDTSTSRPPRLPDRSR